MIPSVKATLFTHTLEQREYEVQYLLITDIFQSVIKREEQPEYASIKTSIQEEGLFNPLLLLKNTKENHDLAMRQVNSDYITEFTNDFPYICIVGNQRLQACKELYYSRVPCIVADTIEWSHAVFLALKNNS